MKYIYIILASSILAGCCSDCESGTSVPQKTITTKTVAPTNIPVGKWIPTYLAQRGGAAMPDPKSDGEGVFIQFQKDGRFNGMSGDNLFGGVAEISSDGAFSTKNVYSTRRMGPFSIYESKFLKALNSTNRIELSGDILKLMLDKSLLLEFKRAN